MDVTVLCDAVAVFPEAIEDALPGWSAEHQTWTEAHLPGNVAADGGWLLHFHSYLVTSERGAVLVDTGIGPAGGEAADWLGTTGRLPRLLDAAGVGVEEIDTVILTHIHLDHAGWNTDGDRPRFPNATYVVQQAEVDHAHTGATYRNLIQPIAAAGQLRAVDGETEVGGLRLLPTPGHTPGHQSVLTDRAVLGGDVLVHPAQARWPGLTYVYERDAAVAVTSRRDILRLAAATGLPIAAAHPHLPLTDQAKAVPLSTSATGAQPCGLHRI
ncbi:glyoxylase-like metal-dependent hydrolase (beta-lactamase superfamily II) [Kribbella sp. VKM Ac-2527]|uniref:Glyoxylase-like metal-dependent hydrolase (Beta-lactamase superfamily II) n=1 Tax=Kribbella caucasensis TaxID=2512215 RepID=A0A4V3CB67_9ACTN|nr:MBL fold metallo-hydrolase [Kribbella sp. VKM Ac-2527]TDO54710.1 glyoxylase-like metal-dependent hydrolase (beta-lactamase superfamily II) [Kribbella sp. VKM Ac-2527]